MGTDRRGTNPLRALCLLICCLLFLMVCSAVTTRAAETAGVPYDRTDRETSPEEMYDAGLEDYDLHEIEDFISRQKELSGWNLSFRELMEDLMAGRLKEVMGALGQALEDSLFYEIGGGGKMMAQIIVLGLIGAIFTNFSNVFVSSQISETGFFVTYLLLFTYLSASFFSSITIAGDVAGQVLEFMRALVPAYFLAAAFAGGSVSSLASYEFTLLMISFVEWLLTTVLLPLVRVYMILVLAGHIARENVLSKMTELLGSLIRWGLKTVLGVVLGFHFVQGMVLPYVDSMQGGVIRKFISVIPGIGQGAGAVTQIILGSGVLIKNTMGAAGVVLLIIMTAMPVMKLVVLMFLYQCLAAVMQPVCDKRIVSCISETAKGHKLLLGVVISAMLLFLITIAMVCAASNISYYSG